MVYAVQPSGGIQVLLTSVGVMVLVGELVGELVMVMVVVGVAVVVNVGEGMVGEGYVSTLSRVGMVAYERACPPSVNASKKLPRTTISDNPAVKIPSKTLLMPNIMLFNRPFLP